MRARKPRIPESETLVAAIEEVQQTYYISELQGHGRRVEDEAILDIVGRIERAEHSRRQHLHRRIEMSFICARSFGGDNPPPRWVSLS